MVACFQHAFGLQDRHQRRTAGACRGAVDFTGVNHTGIATGEMPVNRFKRAGEKGKGEMGPVGQQRMGKADLLIGGGNEFAPEQSEIARLVRHQRKAQRLCIRHYETVAAKGRIDTDRAMPCQFERMVETLCEGRHILKGNALGFAVFAIGCYMHKTGGGFETQARHRFFHRDDAGIQQNRCDTDCIGA